MEDARVPSCPANTGPAPRAYTECTIKRYASEADIRAKPNAFLRVADWSRRDAQEVMSTFAQNGLRPPCATIFASSESPSGMCYAEAVRRVSAECGVAVQLVPLDSTATQTEVLTQIRSLNDCMACDAILVQPPLPAALSLPALVRAIAPYKEVDGLIPYERRVHPAAVRAVCQLLDARRVPKSQAVVLWRLPPVLEAAFMNALRADRFDVEAVHESCDTPEDAAGRPVAAILFTEGVAPPEALVAARACPDALLLHLGVAPPHSAPQEDLPHVASCDEGFATLLAAARVLGITSMALHNRAFFEYA